MRSPSFRIPLRVLDGCEKAISVPPRWINEIVHGKRAITADTALPPPSRVLHLVVRGGHVRTDVSIAVDFVFQTC